jgi:hypothetical protein
MIYTNEAGLPEVLAAALTPDRHTIKPGTFSVTELIAPPQIRVLTRKHRDELTEDIATRLRRFTDSLLHHVLEQLGDRGGRKVERLLSYATDDGVVAGRFDVLLVGTELVKYRSASTWRVSKGVPQDWIERLNLYAEILRRRGHTITAITVVALLKDWMASRSREEGYPRAEVQTFDIPLWEPDQAAAFLSERIALHRAADAGDYPPCSPDERWEKPTRYALMKVGRQKAVKVYDDEETARGNMTSEQHYIEPRPGRSTRCEFYCRVSTFCPQRAATLAPQNEEE